MASTIVVPTYAYTANFGPADAQALIDVATAAKADIETLQSGAGTPSADLTNNSATVLGGATVRVKKSVSLIAVAAGNADTTIWQSPANFLVLGAFLRVTTLPVAGSGFTDLTVSLGTSAGGQQVIAQKQFLANALPAAGSTVGITLSELGSDLASTTDYRKLYTSATTFSFRCTAAGGGITAGALEVNIYGIALLLGYG